MSGLCFECGCDFYPEDRSLRVCDDCARAADEREDEEIEVEDDDDEES